MVVVVMCPCHNRFFFELTGSKDPQETTVQAAIFKTVDAKGIMGKMDMSFYFVGKGLVLVVITVF